MRPVLDVVDADEDKDDGGFLLEDIGIETPLAIGNPMPALSGTDDLDVEIRVGSGNGLGCESDITLGPDSFCGDGVTEEHNPVVLLQRNLGQGGEAEQEG